MPRNLKFAIACIGVTCATGTCRQFNAPQEDSVGTDIAGTPQTETVGDGGTQEHAGGHAISSSASGEAGVGGSNTGENAGGSVATERDPLDYSELVFWLDVGRSCEPSVDGRVSFCVDLSGNSNHAAQVERMSQPIRLPPLPELGGHPALNFTAQDKAQPPHLSVSDSPSLRFGDKDFSYLVVASWKNQTSPAELYAGYGRIVSKQMPQAPYTGFALLANAAGVGHSQFASRLVVQLDLFDNWLLSYNHTLNDGRFRVCMARRVENELQLWIDGRASGSIAISGDADLSVPNAPLIIGGLYGEEFDGSIAELAILRGNVSEERIRHLERLLMTKYDIL